MKDNNFLRISPDLKLRKSGPAFVPIIHNGKALGVKFQSEVEAQTFLEAVESVQGARWVTTQLDYSFCNTRLFRQNISLSVPQITVQHDPEVAEEEDEDIVEEARVGMMNDMNRIKKELFDIKHILVVIETRAKMVML